MHYSCSHYCAAQSREVICINVALRNLLPTLLSYFVHILDVL